MRLTIDTENFVPHIEITEEDENATFAECTTDFCFALSALVMGYIGMAVEEEKNYKKFKNDIIDVISHLADKMLEDRVLEDSMDDELEEELENLREQLEAAGSFSKEEIESVLNIVRETGSIEAATKFLMSVGEEAGIDMEKELEKLED